MGIADDLRELENIHAQGKLSDAEYAAAKATAISGGGAKHATPGRPIAWIVAAVIAGIVAAGGSTAWYHYRSAAITESATNAEASSLARASAVPNPMSAHDVFQMAGNAVSLITVFDNSGHQRGFGSGFVVSPDGATITNYHVIRGATKATAKFSDGLESDVTGVLAYDSDHDVAIIKLQTPPKNALALGNSDNATIGEKVIAIGSPLGFQNTLSEGIVSGMRDGVIQMSAPISPGSSGGPVLDSYGKVMGISVAYIKAGEDMNFAVPINWAKPYLSSTSIKTLAEVESENTVENDFVDGSVTVPAAQSRNFTVTYNPNTMSDAEIDGQVSATGGMGGKITVAVFLGTQRLYQCRDISCEIHQPLVLPGEYVVMVDNRISPMFGRTVSGKLALRYVK